MGTSGVTERPRVAVRLTPDALRQVRGRHPWVFDGSVVSASSEGRPGDFAVVFDDRRKFVAIGLWDPASPIRVRMLHVGKPRVIDGAFWQERVDAALELRRPLLDDPDTNALRLLHGENDGLPGFIADQYDRTLVVKIYTAAWWSHLDALVEALRTRRPDIATVVLRTARSVAPWGDGRTDGTVLVGELAAPNVTFRENGLVFDANVIEGQKTGHFLDQRENRQRVRAAAGGVDVLDVFSHTGGFSVHAAAGGARSVHSVDRSRPAIDAVRRQLDANGLLDGCRCEATVGDAFEVLDALTVARSRFGVVVVDPPSFASRQSQVAGALRAYQGLASRAARLVAPGGLLVQASCSSRVDGPALVDAVLDGVAQAGRNLDAVETSGHALDHPIGFPEGAYLKAIFARLD